MCVGARVLGWARARRGGRRRSRPDHSERRRPEDTTLHKVVRANLRTPHAAVEHGYALAPLPAFVWAEPEGYLDGGLLGRGFAPATAAVSTN